MQTYQAVPLVDLDDNQSAALGVDNAHKLTSADINKPLKLVASDTYGLCASGDEIEATHEAMSPWTVNNGFSFGTINPEGRRLCTVGAVACPFGTYVVAGANAALNVAQPNMVVIPGAPVHHVWRVISTLGGVGAVGTPVVIERVNR